MLLFKERKRLDSVQARQMFGFLFRGYKQLFYYWEVVIIYRKVALIFIQVFLVQYGNNTQAVEVFLLLIFLILVSMNKKPFQTEALNNLETVSLVVSMITIFCGIFFIFDI